MAKSDDADSTVDESLRNQDIDPSETNREEKDMLEGDSTE
jgi:hypothetical protein